MNILIAEDDDVSRELLRRMLETVPDCTLTFMPDGLTAWQKLSDPDQHFDLGIFDQMMPEMSGLQLIERIRATPKLQDFPVVLCTAVKDRATVESARRLGVSYYIIKPYTRAFLVGKIEVLRATLAGKTDIDQPGVVAGRLGVDEDAVIGFVTTLLENLGSWLTTAQGSTSTSDFHRDAVTAHALSGACLSLGLPGLNRELNALIAQLEELAAPAQESTPRLPAEVTERLGPFGAELNRIRDHFKSLSGASAPPFSAAAPAAPPPLAKAS